MPPQRSAIFRKTRRKNSVPLGNCLPRGRELHGGYLRSPRSGRYRSGRPVLKRFRLIHALAAPLLALAGCPDTTVGTNLGSYRVIATRTGGSCGQWREELTYSFTVALTLRPGLLRWTQSSPVDGTYDLQARSFRITLEDAAQLAPANRAQMYPGCTIVRHDVIDGLFEGPVPDQSAPDASVASPPFRASYSISWSAAPGSDCAQYVGAQSTQWAALPCSTTYTLRGEKM